MYAVIHTGGKQYRVSPGQTVKVEKLPLEAGETVEFNHVLMLASGNNIVIGKPYVEGGKVAAVVQSQGRHPKVKIMKFRRRKHYRKQMGHRQYYTELHITGISGPGFVAETAATPPVEAVLPEVPVVAAIVGEIVAAEAVTMTDASAQEAAPIATVAADGTVSDVSEVSVEKPAEEVRADIPTDGQPMDETSGTSSSASAVTASDSSDSTVSDSMNDGSSQDKSL